MRMSNLHHVLEIYIIGGRNRTFLFVPVAQLDRASVSEAEGLEFESQRARFFDIAKSKLLRLQFVDLS